MKNNNKTIHFVVVLNTKADNYKGGAGYRGYELKMLGFPPGPYSSAGAKTLVRQLRRVASDKKFVILPYIGEYWEYTQKEGQNS